MFCILFDVHAYSNFTSTKIAQLNQGQHAGVITVFVSTITIAGMEYTCTCSFYAGPFYAADTCMNTQNHETAAPFVLPYINACHQNCSIYSTCVLLQCLLGPNVCLYCTICMYLKRLNFLVQLNDKG